MKEVIKNEINLLEEMYSGERLKQEFSQRLSHQEVIFNKSLNIFTVRQYYLYQDCFGITRSSHQDNHYRLDGTPCTLSEDENGIEYIVGESACS